MKITEEERIRFNEVPAPLQRAILRHVISTGDLTYTLDRVERVTADQLEKYALTLEEKSND